MAEVTVTINNKLYRLACDEGEQQHLISLARDIDGRIEQLKAGFGEVGDMRLLLMASLTIADELSEAKRLVRGLEAEATSLREERSAVSNRLHAAQDQIARTIIMAAERVERLSERISKDTSPARE
ncbi:MAG: cell division protein ZapA [Rhodobiaceae bacterium]|nr:cell division protein ZapA [Bauldia sp.]MCC0057255.1 cell division protein ZapA [Rhodobiaceae bacterium]